MVGLDLLWTDTCTVYTTVSVFGENKRHTLQEVPLLSAVPCRISFSSQPVTTDGVAAVSTQNVKLFLSNEVIVPPGSRVEVTRNGITETYNSSGKACFYSTHQEIELERVAEA
ncbi:MAG: hypothetical protein IJT09_02640 [Abditibacteriota bacterium]|nr:hypothetical protein [Abditibacteriota bacterium]